MKKDFIPATILGQAFTGLEVSWSKIRLQKPLWWSLQSPFTPQRKGFFLVLPPHGFQDEVQSLCLPLLTSTPAILSPLIP